MKARLNYECIDGLWRQRIDHPEACAETFQRKLTFALIGGSKNGWLKEHNLHEQDYGLTRAKRESLFEVISTHTLRSRTYAVVAAWRITWGLCCGHPTRRHTRAGDGFVGASAMPGVSGFALFERVPQ